MFHSSGKKKKKEIKGTLVGGEEEINLIPV
jgi:hypothetical protein